MPIDSCVFPKSQITFTILNIVNDRQIFTDAYQSQLFERQVSHHAALTHHKSIALALIM